MSERLRRARLRRDTLARLRRERMDDELHEIVEAEKPYVTIIIRGGEFKVPKRDAMSTVASQMYHNIAKNAEAMRLRDAGRE